VVQECAKAEAAFDPLVALFGQGGADEGDHTVAVGEDPDDVGALADPSLWPFHR